MKIGVFSIFLMFCFSYEAVLADDIFPTTAIVYGVMENRSLIFDCKKSGLELITCDFTIAAIRKKLAEDKVNAKILEGMKQYESEKGGILKDKEECSQMNSMLSVIEGKEEPPDPLAWGKTMSTKNQREIDDIKLVIKIGVNFCNNPTENNFRELVSAQIIKDSKTCYVSSQNYQQTLKRVQDFDEKTEIWTVVSEPYGVCGIVQLDRFEREESSIGGLFFWNYYAKKSITNKKGKTLLGVKCSVMDENEYEYNWRQPGPKYMGCEYIEHSIF